MDTIRTTQIPSSLLAMAAQQSAASRNSIRAAAEALTATDRADKLRETDRQDARTDSIRAAAAARIAENTATTATVSAAARRLQDSLTSGLYGVMASAPVQPALREAEPVHVQRIRAVSAYEAASRIGTEGADRRARA